MRAHTRTHTHKKQKMRLETMLCRTSVVDVPPAKRQGNSHELLPKPMLGNQPYEVAASICCREEKNYYAIHTLRGYCGTQVECHQKFKGNTARMRHIRDMRVQDALTHIKRANVKKDGTTIVYLLFSFLESWNY